jgi:hypothetical protein
MSINVKSAGGGDPLGFTDTDTQNVPLNVPADSIIGRLRARTQSQQEIKTKAFPVGGEFGEMLQIRYQPLEGMSQQRAIQINMDMMSRSCVAVEGYDPSTGERTVLKDAGGYKILLDNRLAVLLDMPNESGEPLTAREVITLLVGGNGLAIGFHGDEVTEWMRNPGAQKGN